MAVVCDTGAVYALYDADDVHHAACRRVVETERGPLYLPVVLLAEREVRFMSATITGVVTNGVVVTNTALPEGAVVEILLQSVRPEVHAVALAPTAAITPGELRKRPRAERQTILAAAAKIAEQDYRDDKELTGFDAFSEEELDDDEADSR